MCFCRNTYLKLSLKKYAGWVFSFSWMGHLFPSLYISSCNAIEDSCSHAWLSLRSEYRSMPLWTAVLQEKRNSLTSLNWKEWAGGIGFTENQRGLKMGTVSWLCSKWLVTPCQCTCILEFPLSSTVTTVCQITLLWSLW